MHADEFLREVDENLRYERMTRIWKKYKLFFFAALAVLFVAIVAVEYYKQAHEENLQQQAATYWQAANLQGEEKVNALEPLLQNGTVGFKVLSAIRAAQALIAENKNDAAYAQLEGVKTSTKLEPLEEDLLTMYQSQIVGVDSAERAEAMLKALVEKNSTFTPVALLRLAEMAETAGETAKATGYYERMLDMATLPSTMKMRVATRLAELRR